MASNLPAQPNVPGAPRPGPAPQDAAAPLPFLTFTPDPSICQQPNLTAVGGNPGMAGPLPTMPTTPMQDFGVAGQPDRTGVEDILKEATMAQTQPAPGAGAVPDPGGPSFPVNTAQTVGIGNSSARATPATPSSGVSRPGSTLPLNASTTQSASSGGVVGGVGGVGSWPVAGVVADPGAVRFPVGANQAIGMPPDTATPGGGDPGATGGYVPGAVQTGPAWSQANISGNPNPGALGGGAAGAPAVFPGQTGINQVSPNSNPNPGGL